MERDGIGSDCETVRNGMQQGWEGNKSSVNRAQRANKTQTKHKQDTSETQANTRDARYLCLQEHLATDGVQNVHHSAEDGHVEAPPPLAAVDQLVLLEEPERLAWHGDDACAQTRCVRHAAGWAHGGAEDGNDGAVRRAR